MITDDHKTQTIPEQEKVKRERPPPPKPMEVKQKRPYRRKSTVVSGIASANGVSPASSIPGASIAEALTKALNGIDSMTPKAETTDYLSAINTMNTTNGVSLSAISSSLEHSNPEPPTKRRRASPEYSQHETTSPAISTNVSTPMPHREVSPSSLQSTSLNSPIDFNASFHFNDAMITSPYTESATLSSASSQIGQVDNDTEMDPYSIALGDTLALGDDLILENPLTTVDDRNALMPGNPDMELPPTQQGDFTVIHSLIPNHGSCAGGDNVTVLGNLLEPDMIVQFGKQAALTQFWNAGTLICTVPPCPTAGPVIVSLRRKNGDEVRMRTETLQIFTYVQRISQEAMELALRLMKHAGKDPTMNNLIQMTLDTPNVWDPSSSNGMRLRQAAGNGNVDQTEDLIMDGFRRCDKLKLAHSLNATLKGTRRLTLLHYCAMLDMPRLARYILSLSPRTTYVDASGNTAIQLAHQFNHPTVVSVLRDFESESVSRRSSVSSSTISTPVTRRESVCSIDQLTAALNAAQQSVSHLDSILHRVTDETRAVQHERQHERCECASPGEHSARTPARQNDEHLLESLKERLDQLELSISKKEEASKPNEDADDILRTSNPTNKAGLRRRSVHWKEEEAAASSSDTTDDPLQKTAENTRQFWRLPSLQEAIIAAMQGTQAAAPGAATDPERTNEMREFWMRLFRSMPAAGSSDSKVDVTANQEAAVTQSFVAAMVEHLGTRVQNFQQGLPAMAMPAMPAMPTMPGILARSASAPNTTTTSSTALVPSENYSWRELFTAPPSYDDLFPSRPSSTPEVFPSDPSEEEDELPEPVQRYLAAKGRQSLTDEEKEALRLHAMKIKRIRGDRRLYFVWIPLLIFSVVAMSLSWGPRVWEVGRAVVQKGEMWVESGRVAEVQEV